MGSSLDSVGEGKGEMFWESSIETSILSKVKQITSPGWMHETSAQGWCTEKTQRDGMEREVGGGIGIENTGKCMADSCQCMAKPLKYCKVISLQLIKINEKRKKKVFSNTTVQKHRFFGAQLSSEFNSHIHTLLLENPWLWLDGPLLAK